MRYESNYYYSSSPALPSEAIGKPLTPPTTVYVCGGTAGSATLTCSGCQHNFLSTGGEWGDEPSDVAAKDAHALAQEIASHACPSSEAGSAVAECPHLWSHGYAEPCQRPPGHEGVCHYNADEARDW